MAINKTFSVRHGLDVANTIVLDSGRNIRNVNVANIHTVNANTYLTTAGLNIADQANAAYNAANNAKVTVFANNQSNVTTQNLNFVNTATVSVVVTPNGANANVGFIAAPQTVVVDTFTASGNTTAAATANIANGLFAIATNAYNAANNAQVTVYANNSSNVTTQNLNFVNTATVTVVVTPNGSNANIEFDALNGSTSIIESDVFSANGVQNTFTLTRATQTDKAFVYFSGVAQVPEVDYQISGKTLSFNTAPLNGVIIEVRSIIDFGLLNISSFTSDTFTANGVQTTFNLSTIVYSTNSVFVFVDGVTQVPTVDYTISGNVITFITPPEANGVIEIRSIEAIQIPLPSLSNNGATLSLSDTSYSFSTGGFSLSTDSIARTYLMRGTTTNNTETELFLAGNLRIPVSTNTTIFYTADIVARRTDAINESAGFYIKGVADNFSGTVADVGDLYEVIVAEDDANLAVDARADDTNNTLNIYVTGVNAKTIRWTALVKTVEVAQ